MPNKAGYVEIPIEGGETETGTTVFFTAIFAGDPGHISDDGEKIIEVNASFLRPQVSRATVDPGFGQDGSRIERIGRGVYRFTIDTTGFKGGKCSWHMWGEDAKDGKAHKTGWFNVKDRPEQLL